MSATWTTIFLIAMGALASFLGVNFIRKGILPERHTHMDNPHKRKKQPEQVRRALIDSAIEIALSQGVAAVTMQAVSRAAGVTKGGFLHHFPHKQALTDTVFCDLLDRFALAIDRAIASDAETYGCFTRAYLKAMLISRSSDRPHLRALATVFMLSDPHLRDRWTQWLNARLMRHEATDSDARLAIIRLAADGIWLAELSGTDLEALNEAVKQLLIWTDSPL